jgi:hypothetical protein
LSASTVERINAWRAFFAAPSTSAKAGVSEMVEYAAMLRVVETDWLAFKLGAPGLKIIDLRPQTGI